jgi:hypothetical protein
MWDFMSQQYNTELDVRLENILAAFIYRFKFISQSQRKIA